MSQDSRINMLLFIYIIIMMMIAIMIVIITTYIYIYIFMYIYILWIYTYIYMYIYYGYIYIYMYIYIYILWIYIYIMGIYIYIMDLYIYITVESMLSSPKTHLAPVAETHRDRNAEKLPPLGSRKDYFHPAVTPGSIHPSNRRRTYRNILFDISKHTKHLEEPYRKPRHNLCWLVVEPPTPLKNDGVRQLGLWNSQYMEKQKCSRPPTRYGYPSVFTIAILVDTWDREQRWKIVHKKTSNLKWQLGGKKLKQIHIYIYTIYII